MADDWKVGGGGGGVETGRGRTEKRINEITSTKKQFTSRKD